MWWAIRPSLKLPTLELRAPDSCTFVDDSIAIAALYRSLARAAGPQSVCRIAIMTAVDRALIVENKWRAQRYGIHGTFANGDGSGAVSVAEMLEQVLDSVMPHAEALELRAACPSLPHHRRRRHVGRRAACGLCRAREATKAAHWR